MKPGLWRPPHEEDQAFAERCRQVALPIAGVLFFAVVVVFWWACWKLSELFLT
jgi:hypothetical protein